MKTKYYSQEVLFMTVLFQKPYFWMKDTDNTIYLLKAKNVGKDEWVPDFA